MKLKFLKDMPPAPPVPPPPSDLVLAIASGDWGVVTWMDWAVDVSQRILEIEKRLDDQKR